VYDEVDSFENGKVQVKLNGRVFFLNEKGKEVN
jgi:hypothetical protein